MFSDEYNAMPMPTWWRLLAHRTRRAFSFDELRAGNSIAARIAMMAITTSNSMREKARPFSHALVAGKPGVNRGCPGADPAFRL